jgi:hypothetical protein
MTCMWWCSNTESVPLLVSNTHDIILVRTKYVLVCTSVYDYTFPVPVCTRYVPVRTVTLSVRTKYPDPVPLFTIPGALRLSPSHSFSPSGWSGECIAVCAALSVRRSRHRPPGPLQGRHTPGLTALPLAALRPGQRLWRKRLRRGAFGASGSAASVSRPIYRVLCRVYIPLRLRLSVTVTLRVPILLSVQSVACLPNRLASSRRG